MFGFGKKKVTEQERKDQIKQVVDRLAYKFSYPQAHIEYIIVEWMKFQEDYIRGRI